MMKQRPWIFSKVFPISLKLLLSSSLMQITIAVFIPWFSLVRLAQAQTANSEPNFYQLLGVSENATPEEIKLAVRRQLMKSHPDLNGGSKSASDMTKKILSAKEILLDPNKRAVYDKKIFVFKKVETKSAKSEKFQFEDFGSAEQKPKPAKAPPTPDASKASGAPPASEKATSGDGSPQQATKETMNSETKTSQNFEKPNAPYDPPTAAAKTPSEAEILRNKKNLNLYESNRCGTGFFGAVLNELL